MTEVYKFRSIKQLLGMPNQELERQIIYFASPDQLNDPMEGFRDIAWTGDKIVWANLFKHYVFCLHRTYLLVAVFGDQVKLEANHVPIKGRWDEPPTPQMACIFDDIWKNIWNECALSHMIDNIMNMNHEIRYNELLLFLDDIHTRTLAAIQKQHIFHGLETVSESSHKNGEVSKSLLTETNYFELIRQMEAKGDAVTSTIDMITHKMMVWQRLAYKHDLRGASTLISERNRQILMFEFANIYLQQIEKLLWPRWYTACFAKSYHNSSMWANYSDGHRGVCLIFESIGSGSESSLELKRMSNDNFALVSHAKTKADVVPMELHDVRYTKKLERIDFFRNIGRLPHAAVMGLWYTNEYGQVSDSARHLNSDNDQTRWRKAYWDRFERYITSKSEDWAYERECRLLLFAAMDESLEGRRRIFTYHFETLKGIIFGLRTSSEDKLKIIDVVQEKCRENNLSEFKVYEAYYSPEHGDIRRREIRLRIGEEG